MKREHAVERAYLIPPVNVRKLLMFLGAVVTFIGLVSRP